MKIFSITLFLCLFTIGAFAQKLPATQLHMFSIGLQDNDKYVFTEPQFLSGFNIGGYNNQPSFFNNDELYLTVQMTTDTTQTDIYALNIKDQSLTQITDTRESEYSPQKMIKSYDMTEKGSSGTFSCVRVESDAYGTMRIWGFPMDHSNAGKPIYAGIENTGYHTWLNDNQAALFIVGEPHKLLIANKRDQGKTHITSNIGRCMKKLPNGGLAFVHKYSKDSWLIKEYNPKDNSLQLVTATLPGSEDFVLLPDGSYLMAKGSKLFKFNRSKDAEWKEVADFSFYGIDNISRLALSNGGKLAFVSQAGN